MWHRLESYCIVSSRPISSHLVVLPMSVYCISIPFPVRCFLFSRTWFFFRFKLVVAIVFIVIDIVSQSQQQRNLVEYFVTMSLIQSLMNNEHYSKIYQTNGTRQVETYDSDARLRLRLYNELVKRICVQRKSPNKIKKKTETFNGTF